jgi:DNA modification methylase
MDTLIQEIEVTEDRLRKLRIRLMKKDQETIPGKVIAQKITDNWSMYHGDCIMAIKGIPDESIHYSIFSPPFLSLYVYSDSLSDMGNSKTDNEFYSHFSYLIPELFRVLKTGRLVSVHCSVISTTLQHEGVMGLKDFPGEIVRLFQKFGFIYHSKVVVWKDPLLMAVRTKKLSLAHKQISKDSTRCAQGFMDEVLTFRKPGDNLEPVAHGSGFKEYIGDRQEPQQEKLEDPRINKYSHEVWQRYASPVWFDIDQTDTLNVASARSDKDERHICPLQLQVISRCLELWTNPGDIVFSPFAGIGSEGYESVKRGRKFIGVELKESYYLSALRNLKIAENRIKGILE